METATPPPMGRYQVGVHIADVGHFIKAGTAIDREAASRATTVYLVNRRIDMVPKRLGEDLCSLHEKVDRLAFSCIWEVSAREGARGGWALARAQECL